MKKKYWELNHPLLRILQHLSFWAVSFLVFLQLFKTGIKPEKIDYIYTGLFQISLLPPVYMNLEWLLPRFGKRILIYIFLLVVVITFFAWLNYGFFDNWSARIFPDYFFISYFSFWEVALFFSVYIVITSLLKLSKSWFLVSELQKELLEKEKQRAEIELKALKAQINPHFFFNTLNSVYSMAIDKDVRLPATILQLSGLMRYFLYESKDNFVLLEKELNAVNDYVALQRIRSNEKLKISIQQQGEVKDQKIAPLLLITFLENAFKHGAKGSTGNTFVNLVMQVKGKQLNFTIENNKGLVDEVEKDNYKGVGLENVKRQLELLYPGKHDLKINETADRFIVQLKLEE